MKYSQEQIFDKVSKIMVDFFEIPFEKIKMDSHLNDDLGLDSIDAIDLVEHLQSFVGQRLHAEDFKSVRTISDVILAAEKTLKQTSLKSQSDVKQKI